MATVGLHADDWRINNENLETFSIVWLDVNNNNSKENRNIEEKMRNIINHFVKFDNAHECIEYIQHVSEEERLVLIVSDESGQELVPHIHRLRQVSSIYVYLTNTNNNIRWTYQFSKVGMFCEFYFNRTIL
jgi:hypothetical protein